jgi:hypothetical protein
MTPTNPPQPRLYAPNLALFRLAYVLGDIMDSAVSLRSIQHILRDAGGRLVLTPIPNQIQHDHGPYSTNPSITVEPPPRSYHQSHHPYISSSLSSATFPPGPLPPPSTLSVRSRSGSFDDPSYLIARPQPPSK